MQMYYVARCLIPNVQVFRPNCLRRVVSRSCDVCWNYFDRLAVSQIGMPCDSLWWFASPTGRPTLTSAIRQECRELLSGPQRTVRDSLVDAFSGLVDRRTGLSLLSRHVLRSSRLMACSKLSIPWCPKDFLSCPRTGMWVVLPHFNAGGLRVSVYAKKWLIPPSSLCVSALSAAPCFFIRRLHLLARIRRYPLTSPAARSLSTDPVPPPPSSIVPLNDWT